jgi:murein L,D-transpeptidase YafK
VTRNPNRSTVPLGRGFVVALVGAVFAAGLYIALIVRPPYLGDAERYAIDRTRMANLARASLGLPLPGTPDLAALDTRLKDHGLTLGAPVLIRIFKREFEFELWMARDGRYHRFATYPICRWSGGLGPKVATGDKQAPEGFYTVAADQMNPNSRWHRSFNLGFPNAYDRTHGRTGSALMVHGGCSSAGCYAMTNPVVDEIWRLTMAAQAAGQKRFQVQVYPFRLTNENLRSHKSSPHLEFWRQLQQGSDLFEDGLLPPAVSVCRGAYRFAPGQSVEAASTISTDCGLGVSNAGGRAKKAL